MTEWTVSTLKEHMDTRFEAIREAILKAENGAEQRATKLESETKARFENVNEWRTTYGDQQAKFLPRAEFDTAIKALTEKINAKNVQVVLSLGVGFVAVIVAVFNFASANAGR
jgi:hypothetical protein